MAGKIRVMTFPGAHNLPLYLMDGIEIIYTKSRDEQIFSIVHDEVEVIHTSPDNLLLPDASDLIPFLPGTVGPLHLFKRHDNANTLETQTLGVDNPHSGFAMLAYRWLRMAHLPLPQVVEVGGTPQRFEALKSGRVDMAVMHMPFTQMCASLGFRSMGRIDEGYPTLCGAVKGVLADAPFVVSYRRQYEQALDTLSGPNGLELAVRIFEQHLAFAHVPVPELAERMRLEVIAAGSIFHTASMRTVRELRNNG